MNRSAATFSRKTIREQRLGGQQQPARDQQIPPQPLSLRLRFVTGTSVARTRPVCRGRAAGGRRHQLARIHRASGRIRSGRRCSPASSRCRRPRPGCARRRSPARVSSSAPSSAPTVTRAPDGATAIVLPRVPARAAPGPVRRAAGTTCPTVSDAGRLGEIRQVAHHRVDERQEHRLDRQIVPSQVERRHPQQRRVPRRIRRSISAGVPSSNRASTCAGARSTPR